MLVFRCILLIQYAIRFLGHIAPISDRLYRGISDSLSLSLSLSAAKTILFTAIRQHVIQKSTGRLLSFNYLCEIKKKRVAVNHMYSNNLSTVSYRDYLKMPEDIIEPTDH